MARSDAGGKLPEPERTHNLRPSTAPAHVLDDWARAGVVAYPRGGAPKEQGLSEFLAMGGYAAYVWPAFGFALVVLLGLLVQSWHAAHKREAELEQLRQLVRAGRATPVRAQPHARPGLSPQAGPEPTE
jgi:heme exporter protein D